MGGDFLRMGMMNKSELLTGFIFGICFMPVIGLWAVLLACCTSILWALGGMKEKSWRRWGVPLVTASFISLLNSTLVIWASVPVVWGILSIGYGIPSDNPPDEGSALGRFWYLLISDEFWATFLTRGTIYILLASTYLVLL